MGRGLAVLAAVTVLALAAPTDDVKGTVKTVDVARRKLTVNVEDKVKTFDVAKDVAIFTFTMGAKKKPPQIVTLEGGLAALKPGMAVTLGFETIDEREQVTTIKLETNGAADKAGKKKKKKD